jgi:hypothetical protein
MVLAALTCAGCSASVSIGDGFDRGKAEKTIRDVVISQAGARVKAVACPSNVKLKKGTTVSCTVTGTDGSKGAATIFFKDDKGNAHVSAPLLHVREAESAIAGQLKTKYKAQVTVTCPEIIAVRKGRMVTCKAVRGSDTADVTVTLTDAQGDFDYKLG